MPTWFLAWIFGLVFTIVPSAAKADGKRVALVIGNAAYKHAAELRNPRNDAQDVADALGKLGFTVISGYDLDHSGLRRSIGSFAVALENASVAVLYYAGHGIQVAGANYMVPVDSKLENEYSPEFELIRIDVVQRLMENKRRTNILFLDACRDNPLARNLARAMGTRSTTVGRGLSPTESGIGTLISYSTQPGAVAQDGTGRNSPYAEALVRQLKRDGIALTDMLLDVRRDVMKVTHDRQIPWEHSALRDRFYFAPARPIPVAPAAPPAPKPEITLDPTELTPAQRTSLARSLNRELKRVGCDPKVSDGSWSESSQAALQRFLEHTKLALHTDEPTKAALDAVTTQKLVVCRRQMAPASAPVANPPPAAAPAPVNPPTFTTKVERKKSCRRETESECQMRKGLSSSAALMPCQPAFRIEVCK